MGMVTPAKAARLRKEIQTVVRMEVIDRVAQNVLISLVKSGACGRPTFEMVRVVFWTVILGYFPFLVNATGKNLQ